MKLRNAHAKLAKFAHAFPTFASARQAQPTRNSEQRDREKLRSRASARALQCPFDEAHDLFDEPLVLLL